ncbi:MAG TPA: hypothetical protein VNV87_04505 [Acidimicrobiales bacterium]|jgi:hypothetical protein|nr:hypothetical protein [Acidimicrobiales bacterium]
MASAPDRDYPTPDGWTGGSDDFTFLTTFNGHRSVNTTNNNGRDPGDITDRRNDRRHAVTSFADNGTGYENDQWPEG